MRFRARGFAPGLGFTLVLIATSGALAEEIPQVRFGVMGGPLVPVLNTRYGADVGYQFSALLELGPSADHIGGRLEAGFSRLTVYPYYVYDAHADIFSGVANVMLRSPSARTAPYLFAGAGAYRVRVSGLVSDYLGTRTVEDHQTDLGLDVGGGLSFRTGKRSRLLIEIRYTFLTSGPSNLVPERLTLLPISVGWTF